MYKVLMTCIAAASLLTGCGNFTLLITNAEPTASMLVDKKTLPNLPTVVGESKKPDSLTELKCPVFIYPDVPIKPALPLEQLKKISPKDVKKMDELQQKQIEDLRNYITDTRNLVRGSYKRYLEECKNVNGLEVPK